MSSAPIPHAAAIPPTDTAAKPRRLASLDALRGFNMFWIVGADALVAGLRAARDNAFFQDLSRQLEHVAWEGFHFEDLIFPMFIFIVGVSLVFSLSRTIAEHGRRAAVIRIVRRSLLLYLLGIFFYGGFNGTFENIRLLGVLQRIALCYLAAALIFCFWGLRGRIVWCVGLLVGYWLALSFVPVPGGAAGNLAEGRNLANWVDKAFLPLRKWDGDHDPEGLLSTLPAIANCLIGVLVGMLMRDPSRREWRKAAYLILAGALLTAAGWGWAEQFPVIKKIWTSSYVLVACGYSCLLFALFHLSIDVWGFRLWAQPFVWIGMNPITIYVLAELVDVQAIAQRLVGGQLNTYFGSYGQLVVAVVGLLLIFGVAHFLYRRKVFVRL